MSIQKDMEGLINDALVGMDMVRARLSELKALNSSIGELIDERTTEFIKVYRSLEDILSAVEDLDA